MEYPCKAGTIILNHKPLGVVHREEDPHRIQLVWPYLIFLGTPHNVEKEINIGSVEANESIEHDDFRIGSDSLLKKALLKGLLLFY